MENIKKHMDVAFVRSRNVLRKHCAKNSFQGVRRISSSVCMVFSKPDSIVLSKFPWIGVAILDIRYVQKTFLKVGKKIKKQLSCYSKWFMLGSWYNKIKPLLGPNAHPQISFGDTGEISNLFSFALLKKTLFFC